MTAGCGAKVLRDGIDGIAVADEDAAGLAAAVRDLIRDAALARRLAAAARRRYLASLTWEAVLPAIESVYERVCAAEGAPKVASAG